MTYLPNILIFRYIIIAICLLLVRSFLRMRPIMFLQITKSRETFAAACLYTVESVAGVQALMST